jgi:ComF family protein
MFETYDRHRDVLTGELVVPVPLHPKRLRERGFNQARLIASKLAQRFRLPLDDNSLVRTRYTERHRAGLDALERSKSVSDAFAVKGGKVRGRSVLLVDDLFTTGSTVGAATAVLLSAGATRVNVFTLARIVQRTV